MAYVYGIKNRYTPTHLINKAYGWNGSRANLKDVPTHLMSQNAGLTAEQFRQQFAYEWLNSSEVTDAGLTNPPFTSGAAGRLIPGLQTKTGIKARIQRGYIRRGEVEASKPESKARLYFMFNPETITRDYVSYLDQTALDPFNTVYQSANLVAPPSILDFSFSLFFDRQEEAADPDHPGCFVDYQFFDLVVRNVVPDDPNSTGNTLPDNGVMMVNPREITVIFSQQLTVQGRPLNARVSFVKFTHLMVPTRMQIDLTIRATYLGPLKPQATYVAEEFKTADTIPMGTALGGYQFTYAEVEGEMEIVAGGGSSTVGESTNNIVSGSNYARLAALEYAIAHTRQSGPNATRYSVGQRDTAMVDGYFNKVDCSSLVARSYLGVNALAGMGWTGPPYSSDTSKMVSQVRSKTFQGEVWDFTSVNWSKIQRGDLLLRSKGYKGKKGHVVFVNGYNGTTLSLFHAQSENGNPQVGATSMNIMSATYEYILRPLPTGWASQVAHSGTTPNWSSLPGMNIDPYTGGP